MLLLPPREALNQSPLYRITVELDLNPMLPLSYVTKVRRCDGDGSDLVGEFSYAPTSPCFSALLTSGVIMNFCPSFIGIA